MMRSILIPGGSVPMEVEEELSLNIQKYFPTAKDPEVEQREREKRKRMKFLYDKKKAKEWADQNFIKK